MARPLNEVELFFVKENKALGLEELVKKLPDADSNEIAALLTYLRAT